MVRLLGIAVLGTALVFGGMAPASAVDDRISNAALYAEADSYATGQSVGNCKQWVGQVFEDVAVAAGSSARIGAGFYSGFTDAGGVTVPESQAVRGDLVFVYNAADPEGYYYGMHAAFIVDNLGDGRYNVVDANYAPFGVTPDGKIQRHVWDTQDYMADFPTDFTVVVFRLGTVPSDPDPDPDPDPQPDPQPQPDPPVQLAPVFRFYNARAGTHFYTPSIVERDMVMSKWASIYSFEGIAYYTNPANNTQPLYRFYNLRSQSHFYTASVAERDDVMARLSTIFSYDGETYAVCPAEVPNSIPVFRFFNLRNGSHFYTASISERDAVITRLSGVYSYEGTAFWLGQ